MHVCEVQCTLLFCGMVFLTTTICSLVMLTVIAAVFSHIWYGCAGIVFSITLTYGRCSDRVRFDFALPKTKQIAKQG